MLIITQCQKIQILRLLWITSCEAMTWFDKNCMQANADNCQVGLLSRDPQMTGITPNINDVVLTSTTLLLGVKIDNKLTFL